MCYVFVSVKAAFCWVMNMLRCNANTVHHSNLLGKSGQPQDNLISCWLWLRIQFAAQLKDNMFLILLFLFVLFQNDVIVNDGKTFPRENFFKVQRESMNFTCLERLSMLRKCWLLWDKSRLYLQTTTMKIFECTFWCKRASRHLGMLKCTQFVNCKP